MHPPVRRAGAQDSAEDYLRGQRVGSSQRPSQRVWTRGPVPAALTALPLDVPLHTRLARVEGVREVAGEGAPQDRRRHSCRVLRVAVLPAAAGGFGLAGRAGGGR